MNSSPVSAQPARLPPWFRQPVPEPGKISYLKEILQRHRLHTVCESAHCPNMGVCWGQGAATFMILGERCTRDCRFCAVHKGPPEAVSPEEPFRLAEAVKHLGLRYVVITSVTRDDLPDGGAGHFSRTVSAIRTACPGVLVELLIPDFGGRRADLETVVQSAPDVLGHNLETVARLYTQVRPRADYARSLNILRYARQLSPALAIKSGIMVGMGESRAELSAVFKDLALAGCDILTLGQYLAPRRDGFYVPVARFVEPGEFLRLKKEARDSGIKTVQSAPLARSSFLAEESFHDHCARRVAAAPA
ncbi:MAG TPA: lipoyl synthase [Candidatus Omnitrophota bacterium]|nr:lipoyl synthase [Candidatus Omnitrophota bacterium]HQP11302.1 lipoyl synthase [Candidatus Omnitrophota bacterium]